MDFGSVWRSNIHTFDGALLLRPLNGRCHSRMLFGVGWMGFTLRWQSALEKFISGPSINWLLCNLLQSISKCCGGRVRGGDRGNDECPRRYDWFSFRTYLKTNLNFERLRQGGNSSAQIWCQNRTTEPFSSFLSDFWTTSMSLCWTPYLTFWHRFRFSIDKIGYCAWCRIRAKHATEWAILFACFHTMHA